MFTKQTIFDVKTVLTMGYQKGYHLTISKVNSEEKRIKKFLNKNSDTSFHEVRVILNILGYQLDRVNGSHWIFKGLDGTTFPIPVHNNSVRKCYVKKIIKIIKNETM
ncbi:MAG: type II toxin-antitoxin system HicA family toxin [Candidatus Gracilibacteria bacterium]